MQGAKFRRNGRAGQAFNRRILLYMASLPAVLATQACPVGIKPARLPDCTINKSAPPNRPKPVKTNRLILGIDGSGSMLGYAEASDPTLWRSLLQSLNLSVKTNGFDSEMYRIGGGEAQPIGTSSITQATDPCFFRGCGSYPAVASSLETLWGLPSPGASIPLRLLVTDLEVNQSDISNLIEGVRRDISRGASAGVLALKLPFQGQVFNSSGNPVFNGKLNRPLYVIATGPEAELKAFLEDLRKNMALKGVGAQEVSIIDRASITPTLTLQSIKAVPATEGSSGMNISLDGQSYSPANNPGYGFVSLRPGAKGIELSTSTSFTGGSTISDLGLVRLEPISTSLRNNQDLSGLQVKSMSVDGSNLRLELDVGNTTTEGVLRATIPRGNLPDSWWIEWDRRDPSTNDAKHQTDGLLPLMTKISEEVYSSIPTPAAALCVVFKRN